MANIRTIDYKGSNSASAETGPKGWMFWSGSTTVSGQTYSGLGVELMDTSASYLKFTTEGGGDLDIRAKKFYVGTPTSQFISGSGGDIEISSSNFHLSNDSLIIGSGTTINADLSVNSLFVPAGKTASNAGAYIASDGNAKFVGDGSGNYAVDFSTSSAKIAGWDIGPTFLSSSNIILSSSGTIQTSDFQTSLLGTGKGWKIGSDGIAEFEEARIRGTLSTVTFEKDTISAVGGQVIIANATTVSGSDVTYNHLLDGTFSDFLVESADGFVIDEYIIAKATGSTGFQTEMMKISVIASGSSHLLRCLRNIDGNGYIPTISSGQVLVSQGLYSATTQSGYIHMNADPGDATTPYIDIVERTGSGVDDTKSRARLGDLSGLAGVGPVPADPGFGLYSENVFLSGTITASAGKIGGWTIASDQLSKPNMLIDPTTPKIRVGPSSGQRIEINGSDQTLKWYDSADLNIMKLDDNVDGTNPGISISEGVFHINRTSSLASNEAVSYIKQSNAGNAINTRTGLFVGVTDAATLNATWSSYTAIGNVTTNARQCEEANPNTCYPGGAKISAIFHASASLSTGTISNNNAIAIVADATATDGDAYSFFGKGDNYNDGNISCINAGDSNGIRLYDNDIAPIATFTRKGSSTNHKKTGVLRLKDHTGTTGFYADGEGDVTIEGELTDNSDLRLKKNIRLLESPLSKVCSLRGVKYNWISGKNIKDHIGFIAQEIEEVIPEIVKTSTELADGKPGSPTINNQKSVAYSKVVPYLVEAIKEQQKQIDDLKIQLEALK